MFLALLHRNCFGTTLRVFVQWRFVRCALIVLLLLTRHYWWWFRKFWELTEIFGDWVTCLQVLYFKYYAVLSLSSNKLLVWFIVRNYGQLLIRWVRTIQKLLRRFYFHCQLLWSLLCCLDAWIFIGHFLSNNRFRHLLCCFKWMYF